MTLIIGSSLTIAALTYPEHLFVLTLPPDARNIIRSRIRTPSEPFLRANTDRCLRQVLVENAGVVKLGTNRYPIRMNPKRRLREVDSTARCSLGL